MPNLPLRYREIKVRWSKLLKSMLSENFNKCFQPEGNHLYFTQKLMQKIHNAQRKTPSTFSTTRWTRHLSQHLAVTSDKCSNSLFIQWKKSQHSMTVYKTLYTFSQKWLSTSILQITPLTIFDVISLYCISLRCFQLNFSVFWPTSPCSTRRTVVPFFLLICIRWITQDSCYITSVHNVLTALSRYVSLSSLN